MTPARNLLMVSAAAIAAMAAATPACAQMRTFNIPSQPATSGLQALGRQGDVQLLSARRNTQGKHTNAVQGQMTIDQALQRLLAGTGLIARNTGARTYTIVKAQVLASAAAQVTVPIEQEPSAASPSQDDGVPDRDVSNSEIVVTAQKRSERLIEVPIAISVIDAETLGARNIVQVQDYVAKVPGLAVNQQDGGRVTLSIRGINTGTQNNSTVGVTIDDVPVGSSVGVGFGDVLVPELDPAILERIEVLKGPQGTLYGASSLGGLLKYVTAAPSLGRTSGSIEAGANLVAHGDVGYSARTAVSLPLVEGRLGMQVSGFLRRDAGYIDDPTLGLSDVNRVDSVGGRLAFNWKPADRISVRLAGIYQRAEGDGAEDVDGNYQGRPIDGLTQNKVIPADWFKRELMLLTANVEVDLDFATLTSVTGFSHSLYDQGRDRSLSYAALARSYFNNPNLGAATYTQGDTRKFTQEVRLASPSNDEFEWLIGGFYTKEKSDSATIIDAIDMTTGASAGILLPDFYPNSYEEKAVFGTFTYHFTDRFDVQAGGRYSHNNQHFHESIPYGPFSGSPPYEVTAASSDNAFTFLVSPRFRVSRDLTFYGRVASGYRPGGPNPGGGFGFPASYKADKTLSYELGGKGQFLDRQLHLEASIFWINWDDIQLLQRDPVTSFIYYVNAGKARSRGAELSSSLSLDGGFSLNASIGYTDAELRRALSSGFGQVGDQLPFTPKWSGSFGFEQRFDLTESFTGNLGADVNYLSKRFGNFSTNTDPRIPLPDYTILNLQAGLETDDGWRFTVFAKNLFDSRGAISGIPRIRASPIISLVVVKPRTFGVSLGRTF